MVYACKKTLSRGPQGTVSYREHRMYIRSNVASYFDIICLGTSSGYFLVPLIGLDTLKNAPHDT